ncbi:MAG: DUF1275 domain-containing protein [Sphingomonadales bacterium]|nr:MAG: DUF1275 domain-containing protein [Sphingomonadales bacterium]
MIRYSHSAKALAVSIALLAGFVDAIGFLQSGGLFVSFMSGNSTRLAVGLASGQAIAALAAMIIVSFVAGVVLGSLLGARWSAIRTSLSLVMVALLLGSASALALAGREGLLLAPLAMAMGCANTVFQRDGDVTVGVTYMTGALVRLGQRLADALRGGRRWDWVPFLLLWSGLVSGATAGALMFARAGPQSLWIATIAAAVMVIWARRLEL